MRLSTTIVAILFSGFMMAQGGKNLDLISVVPTDETGNDVWGFKHSNGTEYAIMGDNNSTRIFSLDIPTEPIQIADIIGAESPWRDIKNYGDYLYVVADRGTDGMLIIDMTNLQDSISHTFWRPTINIDGVETTLERCHNIYITQDGYAYLSGCNVANQGILIMNLKDNPLTPRFESAANLRYSHDVYVSDTLMFTSEIYQGELGIYSIADISNPYLLATTQTPNLFTHNAWSSDDNQYVFTTDERSESFVGAYDISDLNDIKEVDKFKPVNGVGAIPHNTHYLDGYLYTSWYTEGVIITDAHRPQNLVEVAYYDTFEGESGGFGGNWGAYPFLPSGLLLASDRQFGLHVLQPSLVRASYLEGFITDSETGEAINGVSVKINSDDRNEEYSDPSGEYKTGQCTPGIFSVTISHPEYHVQTVEVNLASGEVTNLDISLDKRTLYNISIMTVDRQGEPVGDVQVSLESELTDYNFTSLTNEGMIAEQAFEGEYFLYAGKWGFKQASLGKIDINANGISGNSTYTIMLEPGYEDDFLFDFGWKSTSDASSGEWIRDIPIGTSYDGAKVNPDMDLDDDLLGYCYMTGNAGGQAGTDDIDNGTTTLLSPVINLEGIDDPNLRYSRWFYNGGGENISANDSLNIFIVTSEDTTLIETIKVDPGVTGEWILSNFGLDSLTSAQEIQVMFVAQDDAEIGHITEAAIDGFKITEGNRVSTVEVPTESIFSIAPNPFTDQFIVSADQKIGSGKYRIYSLSGKLIQRGNLRGQSTNIKTDNLLPGNYFINLRTDSFKQTLKLVKI